ncbi:MAG: class I SAM-dependent methyltransferase [Candidatus Heimdallarchaeota archaeon]|nr:class I SAM-dependent methyltransferase [Candidatus Heimdallarchaeota archaeon]
MPVVIHHTPLYGFLWHIEKHASHLEKKILDCGCGGALPPLAMFYEHGFEAYGIDIDQGRLTQAENFGKQKGMKLNLITGDMRDLPYEGGSFSFVFSYYTIFHLTKKDMKKAMEEMRRVLTKDGLCFVNFMTTEDGMYMEGEELVKGECWLNEGGEKILHSFLNDEELQEYTAGFDIVSYDKRFIRRPKWWGDYQGCYFDLILQKT